MKFSASLLAVAALSACSGGGGGSTVAMVTPTTTTPSSTTSPATPDTSSTTTGSTSTGSTTPPSGTTSTSSTTTTPTPDPGSSTGSTSSASTSIPTNPGTSTGTGSTASNPPPVVTFDWPPGAGSAGVPLPVASSTTPSFRTAAPVGVTFPLEQALLQLTSTRIAYSAQEVSITLTGTQTISGKNQGVFNLKVPGLNIDVNLPADGTNVALADGSKASMAIAGLDYTLFALWSVSPTSSAGKGFLGVAATGYTTPKAGIPTNGTATYGGAGGAVGAVYYAPDSGGLAAATVKGDANLTIDFTTSKVTGALSNMMATPAGGGTAAPWNTVNLSGSLNVSTVSGSATSSGANLPQNGYSLGVSYGHFDGYLYGPTGQEVGAVWEIVDSGVRNRAALGVFAAQKQ